jgi:hypothetical protein
VQPVLGTLPHGDPSPVSIDFQKVAQNQCNFKAANADDAEISVYIWDAHVQLPDGEPKKCLLLFLQDHALTWWHRRLTRDFIGWFKSHHKQPILSRFHLQSYLLLHGLYLVGLGNGLPPSLLNVAQGIPHRSLNMAQRLGRPSWQSWNKFGLVVTSARDWCCF